MTNTPTFAEIDTLFANSNPDLVWVKATGIVRRMAPRYDFTLVRNVFDDVVRLFHGEYPGYSSIKTLYHDLPHTLDIFLCAVRLMHGVHLSGTRLSPKEITLIMTAVLLHDAGYAQLQGEKGGTGAQYTQSRVQRGIAFMRIYLLAKHVPSNFPALLEAMISTTDHALNFSAIDFPDERTRLLGQIVGTAELTGQMADRTYVEKLLFLYLEFKEAQFGNFQSTYDLLCQTNKFYRITREKLDDALGGIYAKLSFHFQDMMGVETNYYLESIEKNMAYLSIVVEHNDSQYLSMLKRGGIVQKSQAILVPQ
jgi:hypothetical protein